MSSPQDAGSRVVGHGGLARRLLATVRVFHAPPFAPLGERRTVTTLFADVRGLAPLATQGAPSEAIAALTEVFDLIAQATASDASVVHSVLGIGTLSVFGGAGAVDDHAAAGTRAALGVRAALDGPGSMLRQPHRQIQAGLGLNTGTVIAGRIGSPTDAAYTVVGHTVVVASRLAAAALPGQILVGPGTAALLSSEFDLRDRGTMDLAGLGPIAVFELVR